MKESSQFLVRSSQNLFPAIDDPLCLGWRIGHVAKPAGVCENSGQLIPSFQEIQSDELPWMR